MTSSVYEYLDVGSSNGLVLIFQACLLEGKSDALVCGHPDFLGFLFGAFLLSSALLPVDVVTLHTTIHLLT